MSRASKSRVLSARQESALLGLGFVAVGSPARAEGSCYRRGPFRFETDGRWVVLRRPVGRGSRDASLLGRPGLWRQDPRGYLVFDLPPEVRGQPVQDADEPPELARLVQWALDTAEGELPSGWKAPAESIELDPEILTVRSGSLPCQGSLVQDASRLALRFTLGELARELPEQRLSWLSHLLLDARKWRLVRLGIEGSFVGAEVDLSGAPLDLIEPLLRVSLEALRSSVEWLLMPVTVLADPSVECLSLGPTDPPQALERKD